MQRPNNNETISTTDDHAVVSAPDHAAAPTEGTAAPEKPATPLPPTLNPPTKLVAAQALNILSLPIDILRLILLAMKDIAAPRLVAPVCRRFRLFSNDKQFYEMAFSSQGLTANFNRSWSAYFQKGRLDSVVEVPQPGNQSVGSFQQHLVLPLQRAQQQHVNVAESFTGLTNESPLFAALYYKLELLALRLLKELPSEQREAAVLRSSAAYRTTPLHLAASLGDITLFTEMLNCISEDKRAAAIMADDKDNHSVLFSACYQRSTNAIAWLIVRSLTPEQICTLATLKSTKHLLNLLGALTHTPSVELAEDDVQLFSHIFATIPKETRHSVATDQQVNSGMLLFTPQPHRCYFGTTAYR
jgi:hypothetical protein